MSKRLDLNLLVALDALLIERNVTRAAMRLETSQPAVSSQLVRLRQLFSDPLLIAGSRGMTPTPRALEIGSRLSTLISEFRAIVQPQDFDPATAQATVQLGSTDALLSILVPYFKIWAEKAPGIKIVFLPLTRLTKPDIDKKLAAGEFDVIMGMLSFMPERVHMRSVLVQSYVCAVRDTHSFKKNKMSIKDMCGLKHLMISPHGGELSGDVDQALAIHGAKRDIVASVPSFTLAEKILQDSDFAAVFPRSLAQLLASELRLYELPVAVPTSEVVIGWHDRTHQSMPHRWFREQLLEVFKDRKSAHEPKEIVLGKLIK